MSDRNDPSQYPQQAGTEHFPGDTTIESAQVKLTPETDYADVKELTGHPSVDYHDPADTPDVMSANPSDFETAYRDVIREIGKPQAINPISGFVRLGKGLIAGYSFIEQNAAQAGVTETPVVSAARTVSGNSGALTGYGSALTLRAQLNVTAASGTTPTLDVIIEDSLDGGVTWNTIGTFAQKTAVSRETINITIPFSPLLRVSWVIAGTAPSFTFAIDWYAEPVATTPCQFLFHDGMDANAPVVLAIGIPTGGAANAWYLPGGIQFQHGLFVNVLTGSFKGALYFKDEFAV